MNPGAEAATLSPRSINVCQGEEVVIKCTETETDDRYLRWTITFESTQIPTIDLPLNRQFNENIVVVPKLQLSFHSEWTLFSPLRSTLKINTTSAALNGTTVECIARFTVQRTETNTLMITIRGKVAPF